MTANRLALLTIALLGGTMMASAQESALQPGAASDAAEVRQTSYRVLSPADHDLYVRAFDLGKKGNWLGAQILGDQGHNPLARRLLQWAYVLDKDSGAKFADIDAFLKANLDWPLRENVYARAENAIEPTMSAADIVAWFGNRTPASSFGRVKLGEALVATGNVSKGRDYIQKGWIEGTFELADEQGITQRDAQYLTPDVDKQRLDGLLWRDDIGGAKRQMARVDNATQKLAQARIALKNGGTAAQKALDNLPAPQTNDPSLMFDRARAARRAGNNSQAQALLQQIPAQRLAASQGTRWWTELQINARQALQDNDPRTAYALVKDTGLTAGADFADAEFFAGWLALRHLSDPQSALIHFRKLDAGVSRPISKARARYWLARTYEQMDDLANAYAQYKLAAQVTETFYGQIALARIDATPVLHIADTQVNATSARADFEKLELVQAMRVLADIGLEDSLRAFATRTAELYPQLPQQKLLMQLMVDTGYREIAVRLAKALSYNNSNMLAFTYPVIPLPSYPGTGTAPEKALVLGLIRQETEFDPAAISSAGARGIIQVMPGNVRTLARKAGLPNRGASGLEDPNYAIQLGMVEFNGHMDTWAGSLILAAASYNAGPNRAKQWVAQFGDPRTVSVDPIDWIEAIPFTETRNYVQRVLENTQVYRNRLTGKDQPLRILADLYAPNAPGVKVLEYKPLAPVVPTPTPKPLAN